MSIQQKPLFKKVYKRLHGNQREAVNNAIKSILNNPKIGEIKKGDLNGVNVYKFDCVNQQFLLAYEYSDTELVLLALGQHENFYRDLKRTN